MPKLVIGTRGSLLALWQAEYIKERLSTELGIDSRLEIVKTKGDKILDAPLNKIGGKGLFTKELEEMLLEGSIDLAVHSLKDVPVDFVEGLDLACITKREDARDCFLSLKYEDLSQLPQNARVGTTSLRRGMQIKAWRKDLDTQSLRGNVQTRLKRLEDGDFDAIILAQAAINRLKITHIKYRRSFEISEMIPAMGQGALGVQARVGSQIFEKLKNLNDAPTAICANAERIFVRALEGGCQVPIGVHARLLGDEMEIQAILGLPDGEEVLRSQIKGDCKEANKLASDLAQRFLAMGAREILAKVLL